MNMMVSNEFGQYFVRLPLKKSAKIIHGDALEVEWENVVSKNELSYIVGNPPFIGSRIMNKEQKHSLTKIFDNLKSVGELDYVTGWYIKAAKFIQGTKIKTAFVSTNSIVQGLQTSIIWGQMFNKYKIKIHFAHRTFKWSNEAKGNAAVYCVIIGFANYDTPNKSIFEYEDIKGEAHEIKAKNINPYLIDAKDIFIDRRQNTICKVPEMNFGNMPADGGEFLFTDEEKILFVQQEPNSEKYFRKIISAHEFLNNKTRWCLWLENIKPNELRSLKMVLERVENVKKIREQSSRPQLAQIPHLFAQITQPKGLDFILIPRHSSENRKFIPIGFFEEKYIGADSCLIIPNGTLYNFGVLMSTMHMAWVRNTCGRLKSDFRYSKDIVYNNYAWPENPTDKEIKAIETAAQKVLDVRKKYQADKVIGIVRSSPPTKEQFNSPDWNGEEEEIIQKGSSLADLYDPLTMPPDLVKAHNELDKAVDLAYRSQPFTSEAKRMEFLFELYEKYTANLFSGNKAIKGKK